MSDSSSAAAAAAGGVPPQYADADEQQPPLGSADLTHADVDDLLQGGEGDDGDGTAAAAEETREETMAGADDATPGEIAELFAAAHSISRNQQQGGGESAVADVARYTSSAAAAGGSSPSKKLPGSFGRGGELPHHGDPNRAGEQHQSGGSLSPSPLRPRKGRRLPRATDVGGARGGDGDARASKKNQARRGIGHHPEDAAAHVAIARAAAERVAAGFHGGVQPPPGDGGVIVASNFNRSPLRSVSYSDVILFDDGSLLCTRGNAKYRGLVFRREEFAKANDPVERRYLAESVVKTVTLGWGGAFLRRLPNDDGDVQANKGGGGHQYIMIGREDAAERLVATMCCKAAKWQSPVAKASSANGEGPTAAEVAPSKKKPTEASPQKRGPGSPRKSQARAGKETQPEGAAPAVGATSKRKSAKTTAVSKKRGPGHPKKSPGRVTGKNHVAVTAAAAAGDTIDSFFTDAMKNARTKAEARKRKRSSDDLGRAVSPAEEVAKATSDSAKRARTAKPPPPFLSPQKLRNTARLKDDPDLLEAHVERSKAAAAYKKLDRPAEIVRDEVAELRKKLEEALQREVDLEAKRTNARERLAGAEASVAEMELKTRCAWNGWYSRLMAFKTVKGHCAVPSQTTSHNTVEKVRFDLDNRTVEEAYTPKEDPNEELTDLSLWCVLQRNELGDVRPDQNGSDLDGLHRHLLDRAGFVWNDDEARWTWGFTAMTAYKREYGKISVSPESVANGNPYYHLHRWVQWARTSFKCRLLREEQVTAMLELGFDLDKTDRTWESMYVKLKAWQEEHGTCAVPRDAGKIPLRAWARKQAHYFIERNAGKKLKQRPLDRIAKLDALGYNWEEMVTHPFTDQKTREEDKKLGKYGAMWMSNYRLLIQYREERGHTVMSAEETDPRYKGLRTWIIGVRTAYADKMEGKGRNRSKRILSDERIKLLNDIDFDWSPQNTRWKELYAELAAFSLEHGHASPRPNTDLGTWVYLQRTYYKNSKMGKGTGSCRGLNAERIKMLNDIGFEWEQPNYEEMRWDSRLRELIEYRGLHGDCNVPGKYPENKQLASWVRNTRMFYKNRFGERKKGKTVLSDERVRILNAMEFEWRVN